MFKQKEYQTFEFRDKLIKEYVIKPFDQITVAVFSRDGFNLIDIGGGRVGPQNFLNLTGGLGIFYIVDYDGYVTLPVIGDLNVAGYTERELERLIAERMSVYIVDPFVEVRVTNRRCFLFKGITGSVVPLNQSPTTLLEVIAQSGGISAGLKAYKVKLIRGDLKNPQITVIDLSTIEGMQKSNLIVQTNDIIYIEPRRRFVRDVLSETTVLFSIVSTITSLYLLGKSLSGN
ncbi:MAG: polysaccharide biosynthesis/export family protein [Chitinophagales bacterium]|nr:polysaccharide biosynthesis/export family protein [Chitinophagales bacterium]MDW8273437.1 polysaccharide biosynthesis/export family protein [Chitinophagales bacterium]